jgi:hypothetical protein
MFHESVSSLPKMYAAWLQEALNTDLPAESKATCSDCVMCPSSGETASSIFPFQPDLKCCTYTPRLPNFLVGQILAADDLPHGVAAVRARLEARAGVDPLGIGAAPVTGLIQEQAVNVIGQGRALRCPYFVVEDGSCGIWSYRNHLCSTWFCKHERGALGHAFWLSVKALLKSMEGDLAQWAARESGLSASAQRQLMLEADLSANAPLDANDVDGVVSDPHYSALWGEKRGDEEAFFKSCAERVGSLSWSEVLEICGPEIRSRLDVVKLAMEDLAKPIRNLRIGSYQLVGVNADGISAVTYSSLDPIAIPQPILTILHLFDGSPADQIFEKIELEFGIRLHEELVSRLVDYRLLLDS